MKNMGGATYEEMNNMAEEVAIGSDGLVIVPFGNGAERMLNSKQLGTHISNLNLNVHEQKHMFRAGLEGIAFAFVYGMEILKGDNVAVNVMRAGNDNLFRSKIFSETVSTLIGHEIEIYGTTGAIGAARAAGLSDGDFSKMGASLLENDHVDTFKPNDNVSEYQAAYDRWKKELEILMSNK